MTQHGNLYKQTLYYDIALTRHIVDEVDFLIEAYEHYAGKPLQSILSLACGPGYHTHELDKRGYRTTGLDLLPEMISLAKDKATQLGTNPTWVVGDMRDYQLESPVDMTIAMFDALDVLLTHDDIIQHFQTVARNMKPGGIYLLDYSHPRHCSLMNYGDFHYTGERDGIAVDIHWATNNPEFDLVTGVAYVETEINVNDHGQHYVIKNGAYEHLTSPPEFILLARLSGVLKVIGWHGSFDLDQPFDNTPESDRMILIMQKVQEHPRVHNE